MCFEKVLDVKRGLWMVDRGVEESCFLKRTCANRVFKYTLSEPSCSSREANPEQTS